MGVGHNRVQALPNGRTDSAYGRITDRKVGSPGSRESHGEKLCPSVLFPILPGPMLGNQLLLCGPASSLGKALIDQPCYLRGRRFNLFCRIEEW